MKSHDYTSIGVYGILAFAFLVLAPAAYYFFKIDNLRSKQISLYTVMLNALLIQVLSSVFVYTLLTVISFFYRSSSTTYNPKELASLFFSVDWMTVDMSVVADKYSAPVVSAVLLLKTALSVVNLGMLFGIVGLAFGAVFMVYGKALENQDQTLMQSVLSVAISKFYIVFFVMLHIGFLSVFMQGLYVDTQAKTAGVYDETFKPMPTQLAQRLGKIIVGMGSV